MKRWVLSAMLCALLTLPAWGQRGGGGHGGGGGGGGGFHGGGFHGGYSGAYRSGYSGTYRGYGAYARVPSYGARGGYWNRGYGGYGYGWNGRGYGYGWRGYPYRGAVGVIPGGAGEPGAA